jgi:hypothetical protein
VVEELRFLGPEFAHRTIDLVYNGVPALRLAPEEKQQARGKLQGYASSLLGWKPDLLFTHVTRLVKSKGLWRDLLVLGHLDAHLEARGQRALFIVLATEAGRRAPDEVQRLAAQYGWPLVHREGHPDLSPGELEFDLQVRAFNARSRAVRALFINQFGWDRDSCGETMSPDMHFQDLRRGSDAEFGQSIYEPFGIAQVEPLTYGALSVVSDACGCIGFVERSAGEGALDGFLKGEYTRLERPVDAWEARRLGPEECKRLEGERARQVANELAGRLHGEGATGRLARGYELAVAMSWERVAEEYFLPVLERLARKG